MASIVGGGSRGGSSVFGSKPSTIVNPSPVSDLRRVTPGYDEIQSLLSSNLLSGLAGVLPPSVTQSVIDSANARAVAGGFGGSGLGNNLVARDLGLTSKGIQDLAFNQAMNFIGNQSRTATLDPNLQTQIDQFNSLVRASPDPAARANWEMEQVKALANPATTTPNNGLPFGSKTTAIPSGSAAPSFRPLIDWGANRTQMGVGAYNPTYTTPGATSFTPFRPSATTSSLPQFPTVPFNNSPSMPAGSVYNPQTDTVDYDPFPNLFSVPNGTPDVTGILERAGIDPSFTGGGTYNPINDTVERDYFSELLFEPLPF